MMRSLISMKLIRTLPIQIEKDTGISYNIRVIYIKEALYVISM